MFMSVGYTCSMNYSSEGYTENKNTAILSGLTKQYANSLQGHNHCLFQVSQFYGKKIIMIISTLQTRIQGLGS